LHVLVNNAGIEGPFDAANPETTRLADWRRIHCVNVEGVFLGCRSAIPLMRKSGGGSIVNISSTAALVATPDFLAYGASKAAVQHLTRSVALHCARNGSRIRCNSVHPGTVLTAMMQRILRDTAARRGISLVQMMDETRAAMPQGEFQQPQDVASVVAFLASDDAVHMTGASLVVDGAITLGR
jgi:NAD(P)-dependent dehydrogenase (short-subunit alcohol dehydrogenase family)